MYSSFSLLKSLSTTFLLRITARACRLACRSPRLARVIILSANFLNSFALGVVVTIRSCSSREVTIFLIMACWCELFLPSLRPAFLCLIGMHLVIYSHRLLLPQPVRVVPSPQFSCQVTDPSL